MQPPNMYIPSSMLGESNCSKCDVSTRDFDLSTVQSITFNKFTLEIILYKEKEDTVSLLAG